MKPSRTIDTFDSLSATLRPRTARDGAARIDVVGELDLASREVLQAAVTACLHHQPTAISLDLHGVRFMDCAGAAGLLNCRSQARGQEARLRVVEPSHAVTRVLSRPIRAALGIDLAGRGTVARDEGPVRRLECLACERWTPHVPGEPTIGTDGSVLVQWWRCTECEEGNAIG